MKNPLVLAAQIVAAGLLAAYALGLASNALSKEPKAYTQPAAPGISQVLTCQGAQDRLAGVEAQIRILESQGRTTRGLEGGYQSALRQVARVC